VKEVVQSLFDDADFAENVAKHRNENDPTCVFSTAAMKHQNQMLQGAFSCDANELCIPFELGGDGVQVSVKQESQGFERFTRCHLTSPCLLLSVQ
jgi:hypothetical protein